MEPVTILLVEDDDALRELSARVLRNAGYRVCEAVNGEDALSDSERHGHIALLLTDVVMPKIGGVELAERLCSRDPALRVIYMSGYSEAVLRSQGVLRPNAPWLTKPFSPSQLLHQVRTTLDAPV